MTWKRWTAVVLLSSAGVLLGWELFVLAIGIEDALISPVVNQLIYAGPVEAFASGFIAGGLIVHLLGWSPTRSQT